MNISNASVLIVGGSRGLGRALGIAMAQQGSAVTLVARHAVDLEKAVREIREAGGQAFGIQGDIGDKDSAYRISGQSAAMAGPADILVLNSSTLGPLPLRMLLDTECEDLERVLQLNLVGPFRLAKAVAGPMALRGSGLVISISSDAAVEAYAGWGAYGISKAGLDQMTKLFGKELEAGGVRFLSIDPGEMNTQMHADAMPDADPAALRSPKEVAERICDIIRNSDLYDNGARLIVSQVEAS